MKWKPVIAILSIVAIGVVGGGLLSLTTKWLKDTQDWQARKILQLDKAQGEHRRAIADIERKMQTLDRHLAEAEQQLDQFDARMGLMDARMGLMGGDISDLETWQKHVEEKVEGAKMPKPKSRYSPGGLYGG
jgi:chromosome segregation ATPase